MALKLHRLATQQGKVDLSDPSVTLEYLLQATSTDRPNGGAGDSAKEIAIEQYVLANTPTTYSGLTRQGPTIKEADSPGLFNVTIEYKLKEGAPAGDKTSGDPTTNQPSVPGDSDALDETYSFKTTGGTEKITQSLSTVASGARSGKTPPDFKGAIGVNKDKVEGVDRVMGKFEFSMVKQIPRLSLAYCRVVTDLTGRVNLCRWYGFDPGELLFLGATGQTKGPSGAGGTDQGGWTVTYDFAASPNLTDILLVPAGDTEGAMVVPEKRGHDYLWVYYAPEESENKLARTPYAWYVEQIYYYADFGWLGIGASVGGTCLTTVEEQDVGTESD